MVLPSAFGHTSNEELGTRTGDGVRCGGGCKNLNRNTSCFHPGRFLVHPIGSNVSTSPCLKTNSKQYATALGAALRWE